LVRYTREEVENILVKHKLAGAGLAHSRENNIDHIYKLVKGDPGVTLGIELIHQAIDKGKLKPQDVLDTIASWTGCPTNIEHLSGQGYIAPSSTYKALLSASTVIRRAIEMRSTFIFATGHPANMLSLYSKLADYVSRRGCRIIDFIPENISYEGLKLSLHDRVYVASVNDNPVHTHDYHLMEELLSKVDIPDIAIADHGFAGAAVNHGIETICVMDTNDPGVAVAEKLGAPMIVVPFNDSAPSADVDAVFPIIISMVEASEQ